MIAEKREKQILQMSFFGGLAFAVAELIFAIYSHSQSALTDAVYDATELVFIALLLFLTPLFHKPVSEKHPYGYFQVESIFVIIKGAMMLSVTLGICAEVIHCALTGGNAVNNRLICAFQFCLGLGSIVIFLVMKRLNRNLSSPTIEAELLGWKMDIFYSLGMFLAFFLSDYLEKTQLAFLAPYFDQIVAVVVMLLTLPESIRILWNALKGLFLFSPDKDCMDQVKELCQPILDRHSFCPVFFDITKTGRHLWIAVYFRIAGPAMEVSSLSQALEEVNTAAQQVFPECTCELILVP